MKFYKYKKETTKNNFPHQSFKFFFNIMEFWSDDF
jgi:hypothetical protein